ncbi:hypothetical protein [Nocardia harenae]|uniref:hypothetical protein n=1 Tax=Nocardia harenae TaxID=358707 RepID=UPI0012EDD1BD|nr:hypothetical protein [Nocardia harenae]
MVATSDDGGFRVPAVEREPGPLVTHRMTYSDRLRVFLGPGEAVAGYLRPLRGLDGKRRYALNLARLPMPLRATGITLADSTAFGGNFVQCLGAADALTLELCRTGEGGPPRHYVLGLPGPRTGAPSVPIACGAADRYVHADEIFTAAHAAEVFTEYFHSGGVPAGFQLRGNGQ